MADDREVFKVRREAGLRARHETREARAIRRQVAEEIAQAIEAHAAANEGREFRLGLGVARRIAREIGSKDSDLARWLDLNRVIGIKWDDKIIDPREVAYMLREDA